MTWVGTSGQLISGDGFSDKVCVFENEALFLLERVFSSKVECLCRIFIFSSSALKVDFNGTFRAQCMIM